MGFFKKIFGDRSKIYISNESEKNVYKLTSNIDIYIHKYKEQIDKMGINYLYIIRMIYYIEENYNINDINDENIQDAINQDCILLEILINLPPMPLKENQYRSFMNMFYKNAKIKITSNMYENKGLLWQILNKKYESDENSDKTDKNIYKTVSNLIDTSIKLDENTTYTGGIIKIYIDLITMYIYGNMSHKQIIYDIIVERLNNIYRGLLMKLANYMKIIITDPNTDNIQLNVTSKQMKKLNLGKLYIGYTVNYTPDILNDKVNNIKKIILYMETYEKLNIMELYTYLHSNIKQIEKINLYL